MKKTTKKPNWPTLILISLCIGSIAVFGLILGTLLASDYSTTLVREADRLASLSQSISTYTQGLLGSLEIAMDYLNAWIVENPEADPRFDPDFTRIVDVYRKRMGGKVDIRMVSETGGLYYIPSAKLEPLADVRDREYFRARMASTEPGLYVASSVLSRVTGKWGIPISYKLSVPSHGIAIIFAALELDVLSHRFDAESGLKQINIYLVRNDGTILTCSPFDEAVLGQSIDAVLRLPSSPPGSPAATTLDQSMLGIRESDGSDVFVHRNGIEGLPLAVYAVSSRNEVLKPWFVLATIRLVIIVFVGIIVIALTLFGLRQIRKAVEYQRQIEHLATTDTLTGLLNRGELLAHLSAEVERGKRYLRGFGFMMIDLDHFKEVNDRYGHPEGDRVLREFAGLLTATLRQSDVCGRVGGEEFAVILPETDVDHALAIAERIRAAVPGITLPDRMMTVSIGVTLWENGGELPDQLYSRADVSLYQAKELGRNRVVFSS